jgi:hypothetical protein
MTVEEDMTLSGRRWMPTLAAACGALLLASCYSSGRHSADVSQDDATYPRPDAVDQPADPVFDPVPDLVPDAIVDDVPPDEPPGPGITFILHFITDIPGYEYLYVQQSDMSCRMMWISIHDGTRGYAMEHDCAICLCDECTGCAVCGACMQVVIPVAGGESVSHAWDGTVWATGMCSPYPDEDWTCEIPGALAPGDYRARFCYAVAGPGAFPDGIIPDPMCEDIPFTYPVPGGVVEYTVNNSG